MSRNDHLELLSGGNCFARVGARLSVLPGLLQIAWRSNWRSTKSSTEFITRGGLITKLGVNRFNSSGNYLDQCWSNKILVWLCEGPKPQNSMISGFPDPWNPVFIDLNIPNYFNEHEKYMESVAFSFINRVIWNFENSGKYRHRTCLFHYL